MGYSRLFHIFKNSIFCPSWTILLIQEGISVDVEYVRERITQLRLQKGVSEYKMSYDLGHSRGYINNISSGKTLPSMTEFFAICDYFGITPIEFFDRKLKNPSLMSEITEQLSYLDENDLAITSLIIKRFINK